jgi:hypothetical protein
MRLDTRSDRWLRIGSVRCGWHGCRTPLLYFALTICALRVRRGLLVVVVLVLVDLPLKLAGACARSS